MNIATRNQIDQLTQKVTSKGLDQTALNRFATKGKKGMMDRKQTLKKTSPMKLVENSLHTTEGDESLIRITESLGQESSIQIESPEQMAQDVIEEFEKIDRLKDPFDRKMRKTQILMSMQASNVTMTLKEIHSILLISKPNKAQTAGQS